MEILKVESLQKLTISSAYINFPQQLVKRLQELKCEIELITAAPQANSFYKAGIVRGHIPRFYRYFEQGILKAFRGKENAALYEFRRDGWTYHSKGVWFYEKDKLEPNATLIGSSNYSKEIRT
jgi:CDP-diacylglycerol--glycerol-3-phosphate 3-phosphatidyltransferase